MKNFYILLFSSIILISSCGPTPKEAAEYNDQIIKVQIKTYKKILELEESFDKYIENNYDPKILDNAMEKAVMAADSAISFINSQQAFYDDSSLLIAAEKLFKTYKFLLDNQLKECVRIYKLPVEEYTDKDREEFENYYKQTQDSLTKIHNEFSKVQKEFAKKYNLNLDSL